MSLSTNSRNVGAVVKKYNQDDYHTLMAKAVARTPLPVEKRKCFRSCMIWDIWARGPIKN